MYNCPFYGRSMFRSFDTKSLPFILIGQQGNQCALVRVHKPGDAAPPVSLRQKR